jgi:hypothetical protein
MGRTGTRGRANPTFILEPFGGGTRTGESEGFRGQARYVSQAALMRSAWPVVNANMQASGE